MRFVIGSLFLIGCAMGSACERDTDSRPDVVTSKPQPEPPAARDDAKFDGLVIDVGRELAVDGTAIAQGAHPTGGDPKDRDARMRLPGLDARLRQDDVAKKRERGVLVRAASAVPFNRLAEVIYTVRVADMEVTHLSIGGAPPVELGDAPREAPGMHVTLNSRGMTVTVGSDVVPAVQDCTPGPTLCVQSQLPIQAHSRQAFDKLKAGDDAGATGDVAEVVSAFRIGALAEQIAAAKESMEGGRRLAVAAHPYIPLGVVQEVFTANCATGDSPQTCTRHFDTLALTVPR